MLKKNLRRQLKPTRFYRTIISAADMTALVMPGLAVQVMVSAEAG